MKYKFFTWGREGLQTKSYISEDSNSVLKLFKTFSESEKQLTIWGKSKEELDIDWHSNGIISSKLAFEKIDNLTGILEFHDGLTDIGSIMIDKKKIPTLGLPFVIQEKVILVCEVIPRCIKNGDLEGAKKVIDDVFELIKKIRNRGITEDTFNYDHNYGYNKDGKMIQIDIGSFWEGDKYIKLQIENKELLNTDRNQTLKRLKEQSADLFEYHIIKSNKLYEEFKNN